MKINFPDGGNPDVVNLEREDDGPHDGHQDHEDDTCNYSGHLLQEPGDLKRTNLFIGMLFKRKNSFEWSRGIEDTGYRAVKVN